MTPLGLPRVDAATYVGCSARMFDGMVKSGRMPKPRLIGAKKVWDTRELTEAFEGLPRAEMEIQPDRNDWDDD